MKKSFKKVRTKLLIHPLFLFALFLLFLITIPFGAAHAQVNVLWWDATPTYGSQCPDALRKKMCDYLTTYNAGNAFQCTYVSSMAQGEFANHMQSNTYDVIVLDATNSTSTFSAADRSSLAAFYANHPAVLLDGILYIRSIDYNTTTNFPGINQSTGGLTVNEVYQVYAHGGGVMIGTDHQGHQAGANAMLQAIIPGASFTGITYPSVDGQFNGTGLLEALATVSPFDLFQHWDAVPTQAISPTGVFTDVNGNAITLYSQVDVADDPGGGPKYSYISTSWEPSGDTPEFDCNNNGILDSIDIQVGTSTDCDGNGIPDECDPDCNQNGVPDACDIADGISNDCNLNGIPDICDLENGTSMDCNQNGTPDECDIADGTSLDCNRNSIPDACDIAGGTSQDLDLNGIPDECEAAVCGDLDLDGDVDGDDRSILRAILNTPTGEPSFIQDADYDADGLITYNDYRLWYQCYKAFTEK
ncbi:MAG: hypothetical protein V6Z89_19810 [Desulfobacter sp.]